DLERRQAVTRGKAIETIAALRAAIRRGVVVPQSNFGGGAGNADRPRFCGGAEQQVPVLRIAEALVESTQALEQAAADRERARRRGLGGNARQRVAQKLRAIAGDDQRGDRDGIRHRLLTPAPVATPSLTPLRRVRVAGPANPPAAAGRAADRPASRGRSGSRR